jgi:hypothetical protein
LVLNLDWPWKRLQRKKKSVRPTKKKEEKKIRGQPPLFTQNIAQQHANNNTPTTTRQQQHTSNTTPTTTRNNNNTTTTSMPHPSLSLPHVDFHDFHLPVLGHHKIPTPQFKKRIGPPTTTFHFAQQGGCNVLNRSRDNACGRTRRKRKKNKSARDSFTHSLIHPRFPTRLLTIDLISQLVFGQDNVIFMVPQIIVQDIPIRHSFHGGRGYVGAVAWF